MGPDLLSMMEEEAKETGNHKFFKLRSASATLHCQMSEVVRIPPSDVRILLIKCGSDSRGPGWAWNSAFYPAPGWGGLWISCWSVEHTLSRKTSCLVCAWCLCIDLPAQWMKKLWGKRLMTQKLFETQGLSFWNWMYSYISSSVSSKFCTISLPWRSYYLHASICSGSIKTGLEIAPQMHLVMGKYTDP